MNIISVVYIISAFIAFESAITVLRLNRRAPENIVYALFTFDFALFTIFFSQFVAAHSRESASLWLAGCNPTGCLLVPLGFHFSLLVTGRKRAGLNPVLITLLYLPSLLFTILIARGLLIKDIFMTPWGWDNRYADDLFWAPFYLFYYTFVLLAGAGVVFQKYIKSQTDREKKQLMVIVMSYIAGTVTFMTMLIYLFSGDSFYYTVVSDIAFAVFFTFYILGIRWAIIRYKLMSITPSSPVMEIIAVMKEPAMLTNSSGGVICANRRVKSLAENPDIKRVQDFFTCGETISLVMEELARSGTGSGSVRCTPVSGKAGKGLKSFILNIQALSGDDRVCNGFMVTAKEDPSLKDFLEKFSITGRQADIIFLAISGLSNRAMAERLNLSERTIENHMFNIYNKIGIDNRIELLNIAGKYGLLSN